MGRNQWVVNGSLSSKKGYQGQKSLGLRLGWWQKGFTQREGIDYTEVFSLVVRHTSIIVLLALVATLNLELEKLDVKTIFFHGELEETINMKQPQGFEVQGGKELVCLLKKSVYGLKQSPCHWNKCFDDFMVQLVLVGASMIAVFIIGSRRMERSSTCYFMQKDLGPAKRILGIEITKDRKRGILYISRHYIHKVLQKFGMANANPVPTPLA